MINIGTTVEIKSIGSNLIFNCDGDFANQSTILGETTEGLQYKQKQNEGKYGKHESNMKEERNKQK